MRRRPRAVPRPSASSAAGPGEQALGVGPVEGDVGEPGVVPVTDTNFFDLTAGCYTVVDFWAVWCGPCRTFAPIFKEVAEAHTGGVRFGACNVDESPRAASLVGIRSIPTLVVFGPDGSEIGRRAGALPQRALEQLVAQLADSPT